MQTTVRVFEVKPNTGTRRVGYDRGALSTPPPPTEQPKITVTAASEDLTKEAARVALAHAGWTVRSLNWAPPLHGQKVPHLVAYVYKPEDQPS